MRNKLLAALLCILVGRGETARVLQLPVGANSLDSLLTLARSMPKPVEIRLHAGNLILNAPIQLGPADSSLIITGSGPGTMILGSQPQEHEPCRGAEACLREDGKNLWRIPFEAESNFAPKSPGSATRWSWALFDSAGIVLPTRVPSTGWIEPTNASFRIADTQSVQGFFGDEYQDRITSWKDAKSRKPLRLRVIASTEGLSQPGTWANSGTAILMHPRGAIRSSRLPWMLEIVSAQKIELRNITFAQALNGVRIQDGRHIRFSKISILDIAGLGMDIVGGSKVSIDSSILRRLGAGGIRIGGGDRSRLLPSRHRISNTRIDSFALWNLSYRPAISVWGVGVDVDRCEISNGPHCGVLIAGNDHHVSRCTLSSLAQDTRDVGAIYMGRDLGSRGVVIDSNQISDILGFQRSGGVGIYLDDLISGVDLTANRIHGTDIGILIGGGSWNVLRDNTISDTRSPVYHDCRGSTWARHAARHDDSWNLLAKLSASVGSNDSLWKARYGPLVPPLSNAGLASVGNRMHRGVVEQFLSPNPSCPDSTPASVHPNPIRRREN